MAKIEEKFTITIRLPNSLNKELSRLPKKRQDIIIFESVKEIKSLIKNYIDKETALRRII